MTDEELAESYMAHADETIETTLRFVLDRMPTPRMALLTLLKAAAHVAHAHGDTKAYLMVAAESAYAAVGVERREIEERRRQN